MENRKETNATVDIPKVHCPDVESSSTTEGTVDGSSSWEKSRQWIRGIGAEEYGIERVPESRRIKQSPWSLFIAFFSFNCCTTALALGYLGPTLFGLGWWDSFLCVLFFNLIGAVFPAIVSAFGHRTGLRTLILPRFSFGWWPTKVVVLLNIFTQMGWAIVNALSGGDILFVVGGGKLPKAVCVILIGAISIIIALFGYDYIHAYQRYAWLVMLCCFAILAGFGGSHFENIPMGSGTQETASVLAFGTAIIGCEVAWVPCAADYSVYMNEETNDWVVVACSYGGLFLSQFLLEALGAALGTLISSPDERFRHAYDSFGLGGLIEETFADRGSGVRGLGTFVQIVISFSTAAVGVVSMYSIGLSFQMMTEKAVRVPRFLFTVVGGVVFLVCAVAGRDHLESVMTNFANMCAYYLVPMTTVLLAEHYLWRKGFTYNLTDWNDKEKLPVGIAAAVSFALGTLVAFLCMSQVWWVGPIAAAIGGSPTGTDISWMLAPAVTLVVYLPGRYWELRKWKR
ncbi:unnamed protein product [Clonostachys solani]|uniref:Purine-cytosine permease n=1 Tax=Clonostachys solani TaxID=160281 RepID=A0A9N9W6S3_9HYPO|nr:unnamed protein product [Clonostachys solani]